MITAVRQLLTCHWTSHRVQRYLDADPDAHLAPDEVARLEAHLAACERCTDLVAQHKALHWALSTWSRRSPVDPASVDRVRRFVDELSDGSRS